MAAKCADVNKLAESYGLCDKSLRGWLKSCCDFIQCWQRYSAKINPMAESLEPADL